MTVNRRDCKVLDRLQRQYSSTKLVVWDVFKKNGFSIGAGIEYDLSQDLGFQGDEEEGWGLFADWQNLAYHDTPQKTNVNVVSAGITYDF